MMFLMQAIIAKYRVPSAGHPVLKGGPFQFTE
jgi:hypothetical protein